MSVVCKPWKQDNKVEQNSILCPVWGCMVGIGFSYNMAIVPVGVGRGGGGGGGMIVESCAGARFCSL